MRIAYLVAGAGRMYCGACMRDNRVAAKLIQQGRDVSLIPLYMPIRTDEVDVSIPRVYYGGVNVSLQQNFPLFRRIPKSLDRLLDSPRLLRSLGRLASRIRPAAVGRLTVSVLAGEHGAQRKELGALIAGLRDLKPALVNLPNLMFVGTAEAIRTALGVPVLCTLAGEDFFLQSLPEPHRGQAMALVRQGADHVDGFIAPTKYYAARAVDHFGLDRGCVHHVPMGIHVDKRERPADLPELPAVRAGSSQNIRASLIEAFSWYKALSDRDDLFLSDPQLAVLQFVEVRSDLQRSDPCLLCERPDRCHTKRGTLTQRFQLLRSQIDTLIL